MIVREAMVEDAPAIAKVHIETWRTTYHSILPEDYLARLSLQERENRWVKMLNTAAKDNHFIYVAENESGQIIAFADGGLERTNDPVYKSEIYAIYILEAYQQQGLGRILMQTLVKKFDELGFNSMLIWVLERNPACQFYEALGGQKVRFKQIEIGGNVLD
ncbi:MAG: GNAT family N-acetyltransferase [Hydrococcus sp. RU_2_2]|nr:GNAT family N-acetyltransferase [Hydrococcus sp. RU_2_2]NJP20011.1 GNAT family N-acetyltransferase [Hydrococcus sp. CRU_1_1]